MLYKENLTYEVIGVAMEVYNELGYGFLEKVYENSLIISLREKGIRCESQVPIDVYYHGEIVGKYIADIIVEEVILELKTMEKLNSANESQLLNYLKATNKKLGLLLNFSPKGLEYRRFIK